MLPLCCYCFCLYTNDRYWEASLPPSHIPSDSKMENFIRTKYSSKRWVLSPTPPSDPSVLDDVPSDTDTDDVPLAVVKQNLQSPKQQQPAAATGPAQRRTGSQSQPRTQAATANLLSDTPPPPRTATPELTLRTESPSARVGRPRQDRVSNQSLIGLEFDSPVRTQSAPLATSPTTTTATSSSFGGLGGLGSASASSLGASSAGTGAVGAGKGPVSRNDLKNSILKLYAPKPVTAPSTPSLSAPSTT